MDELPRILCETAHVIRDARGARRLSALILGVGIFLALSGVVPLLLLGISPDEGSDPPVKMFAVVGLAGLRYAWLVASANRHLHEMVVWLFVYLFLGVAPIVQVSLDVKPSTTPWFNESLVGTAVDVVLIGCLALILGSRAGAKHTHDVRTLPRVAEHRVLWLTGLTGAFVIYYVSRLGVGNIFAARGEVNALRMELWPNSTVSAILYAFVTMGILVVFVAHVQVRRQRIAKGRRAPIIPVVFWLVVAFAIVNPIANARYVFGTVALGIAAALGAYSTSARYRLMAVAALAGMVLVFPALDAFRHTLDSATQITDPLTSLTSGDFDSFAQIVNTIDYVAEEGHTRGRQLLGVVFFWIPRAWWPNKPLDTGTLVAEHQGYGFLNLSAPMWSELFINGGWIALVLGMFALGYILRYSDGRAEMMLRAYGSPGVLGSVIPFYLLIMMRGSLLQSMSYLLVILVLVAAVTSRRLPHREAESDPMRRATAHSPAG